MSWEILKTVLVVVSIVFSAICIALLQYGYFLGVARKVRAVNRHLKAISKRHMPPGTRVYLVLPIESCRVYLHLEIKTEEYHYRSSERIWNEEDLRKLSIPAILKLLLNKLPTRDITIQTSHITSALRSYIPKRSEVLEASTF